jgi:transposase InsO family protein
MDIAMDQARQRPPAVCACGIPDRTAAVAPKDVVGWALQHRVQPVHSEPGKPNQDAFVERVDGHVRDEGVNQHWFLPLATPSPRINGCATPLDAMAHTGSWTPGALASIFAVEAQLDPSPILT